MRTGFATITCGKCHKKIAVIWSGHKYRMPCPWCAQVQTVKNTRLRKFKPVKMTGGTNESSTTIK